MTYESGNKKNGTGELLPKLQRILQTRGIQVSRINAGGSHAGWITPGAVFVAKKEIWKGVISAQEELVEKCIQHGRWLVFWIPNSAMLRFNPKRFKQNAKVNYRGREKMLNVKSSIGSPISSEELSMSPFVSSGSSSSNANQMAIDVESNPVSELNEWRQKLGAIMAEYSEKFDIPIDEVKEKLYRKLDIHSRTELGIDQLKTTFESYRISIESGQK